MCHSILIGCCLRQDRQWENISAGQHHTLALDTDGRVYSVGRKEYGRLGLGADTEVLHHVHFFQLVSFFSPSLTHLELSF